MGYNLYITRADDWSQNTSREIQVDEWVALINGDPELVIDERNGSHFASWRPVGKQNDAWFDLDDGNVYTKDPDAAAIIKMAEMARRLKAKVQGEEGELYRFSRGVVVCESVGNEVRTVGPWKERLLIVLIGASIGTTLLVACLLLM